MKLFLWLSTAFLVLILIFVCNEKPVQKDALSSEEEQHFLQKGQEATSSLFAALSSQLQQAIADSGAAYAVSFCSTRALPITDSISTAIQGRIRRTAIRWRNPLNAPNPMELQQLETYDSLLTAGLNAEPVLRLIDPNKVGFYAPILTAPLCTTCHGVETDIAPEVHTAIRHHYPLDRAKDFKPGDLRGMWSIVFDR